MKQNHDMMGPREAAAYLSLNEQTVRRLARQAAIPAFKVGGVWRFRKTQLAAYGNPAARTAAASQKILVIDDDNQLVEAVRRTLEPEGYSVLTATDGPAGLVLLDQRPALIYLDLLMPDMLGPEVLRHIRARLPRVAVVILTAYPDSDLMRDALQYSPITLLAKPFSRRQLLDTTDQVLNGTSAVAASRPASQGSPRAY